MPSLRVRLTQAKQQIAQFVLKPFLVAFADFGFDLGQFLAHLAGNGGDGFPVKADAGSAFLELESAGEGGKGGDHPVELAFERIFTNIGAFPALQFLPGMGLGFGVLDGLIAEYMRVTPHHFFGNRLDHGGEIEITGQLPSG